MGIDSILKHDTEAMINIGIKVALIIIVALAAYFILKALLSRAIPSLVWRATNEEEKRRFDTLGLVIRQFLGGVIIVIAVMMVLKELGVDIGPIIAAAGVVGLAVGFGARSLVEDMISGFFILLEDQVRVGDVVEIGGKSGLVEKITLRMIILRDLSGNVHYVRNGQIVTVTNMTKHFSFYVFDIGVAYREDIDEVIAVIRQVDAELRDDPEFSVDILEPIEILGLDKFADSAVIVKARTKTRPIQQWRIGREFNRRLKRAFDARGIEIPFPHVTLYMGQGKDGSAPSIKVDLPREGGNAP